MSQTLIVKALMKHLEALTPTVKLIVEASGDKPPDDETVPYQKTLFMPAEPDNIVKGARVFREHGILQVALMYRLGVGSGTARARADLLRSHFKRGTSLEQGGIVTMVTHTPAIAQGFDTGGRWCVPVSIRWQAWVPVA